MSAEIQVTNDVQVAPIYDPDLHPSGNNPVFSNQSAIDVFVDTDPQLLNASPYGAVPISGVKIAAGTGQQVVIASRKLYARAQSRTTIMILGLLLACVLGLPNRSQAQASNRADCYITGIATATGEQITPGYDNRAQGSAIVPCTAWHLVYYASQAATVGIQIMYAPDLGGSLGPGSFTAAVPVSGPTPLTSITGAGHTSYTFSPWINVNVSALTGTGAAIHWQLLGWRPGPSNDVAAPPTSSVPVNPTPVNLTAIDPCQSPGIQKTSISSTQSSAATNAIIGFNATKNIYICGVWFNFVGASQTANLEIGGGATCGTGTSVIVTPVGPGSAVSGYIAMFPESTMAIAIGLTSNQNVCIVSTGATVSQSFGVVYVQQ